MYQINIKSDYSLLSSLIKIDDLINYAKDNNMPSLALSDDNLCGAFEFYKKCRLNKIKPIIGLDTEFCILYAINYNGYLNLIKIEKDKSLESIIKNSSDLVCIEKKNNNLKEYFKYNYNDLELDITPIRSLNNKDLMYIDSLTKIKDNSDEVRKLEGTSINLVKTNAINKQIHDICNIKIIKNVNTLPKVSNDDYALLKKECIKGLKNIFGDTISKVYKDRIKYELDVINKMGFCNYFLIVSDYVRYAKENNILVGPGRGSAAGSLVAYVLNITEVDPIKYDLLFERFLNEKRITMPDIDIDFEYTKRDEVINYCISKYGKENVAGIITFGTFKAKQALRDVFRINKVDKIKENNFIKRIDSNLTLKENYKAVEQILKNDSELKSLYKIALKIEGLKRNVSTHAAGIVITDKNLDNYLPTVNRDNMLITSYTMEYLEDIGILKMDFLALKNLTIIKNITDNIGISSKDIKLDDELTYNLFSEGNSLGIFQFEKEGIMNVLKKYKPKNIYDLSNLLALYRPGPIDNIDSFIRRKDNKEKIDYIVPELEAILKSTYGIIVYQEQIMKIVSLVANYTLEEADILRRAISKKKEAILKEERTKFIKQGLLNNYNEEDLIKIFNLILKFASYGFNKSHSVSYAFISYQMAYLKANYPLEFYQTILNLSLDSEVDTIKYIKDAKRNNIEIKKPIINMSSKEYKIIDNYLMCPITIIKSINSSVINEIVKHKYDNIYDFIEKNDKKILTKPILEVLINSGLFDEFENKKTLMHNLDKIINYVDIAGLVDTSLRPILDRVDEYSDNELSNIEVNTYGFYISNHPVIKYKLKTNNVIDLKYIKEYFDKYINVICIIDNIKSIKTKNNKDMAFIKLNDETSSIDGVLFDSNKYNIEIGDIVNINAKVEKRFDKYQLVIRNINILK